MENYETLEISLEKIELVKDRTGVSYKEAKEALEKSGGNVVDAIISIEEKDYRRLRKDELLHILGKLGMGGEVPIKQATIQNQLGPGRTVYFAQPVLSDAVTKGA